MSTPSSQYTRTNLHRIAVPEAFRDPATPWPGYNPPEWTDPAVFDVGVRDGWAEPETDPVRIDWRARQMAAHISYVQINSRPINPVERTGLRGRGGLGLWGENPMADAIVFATVGGCRYLLMVKRSDGHGWALPGGSIELGENPMHAALRELHEETGLDLTNRTGKWRVAPARYVRDPRGTDEAWVVTLPIVTRITGLEPVTGADDADLAEWIHADTYAVLRDDLQRRFAGAVFTAHEDLLQWAIILPAFNGADHGGGR